MDNEKNKPFGLTGEGLRRCKEAQLWEELDKGNIRDRDFKRQLDCAVVSLAHINSFSDEHLAKQVCDMSDAIFAERKKREARE